MTFNDLELEKMKKNMKMTKEGEKMLLKLKFKPWKKVDKDGRTLNRPLSADARSRSRSRGKTERLAKADISVKASKNSIKQGGILKLHKAKQSLKRVNFA